MTTGLKAWRRGQLGKETTSGTPVAATRVLHYESMEITDAQEFYEPEEELNTLSLVTRSDVVRIPPAEIAIAGDLTFEDIVYWVQGTVKGGVAPTQPDAAVDLYSFVPTYAATNQQTTYTIEGGDNEEAVEVDFAYVEDFEITFASGEPAKLSVNLKGQKVTVSSFTGALTTPTVETAKGASAFLYNDALAADIGTTLWPDCAVIEGRIKVFSGLVPKHRAGCGLEFAKVIEKKRRIIEASITVEEDANADALRTAYQANTKSAWRLEFQGEEIVTNFPKFIRFDFWAPLRSFVSGEDDGVNTRVFELKSEYDPTWGAEAKVYVQNELNAVTEF